jgi:hypothetical protein
VPIGITEQLRRIAAKPPRMCAVGGCDKTAFRVGRYCDPHQKHAQAHGSPTATGIRLYMTKFYRRRTDKFLEQNREHPAVLATVEKLQQILNSSRAASARPRRGDWRGRANHEIHRLQSTGVTGFEALGRLLPLWYMSHADKPLLEPASLHFRYTCARHVLNLRDRSDKEFRASAGTNCGSHALNHIGEKLVNATLHLAQAMLKSFDATDAEPLEYRETVLQAVEAAQVKSVAQPPKRTRRPSTPKPTPPLTPPVTPRATEVLPDGTVVVRW